VADEDELVTEHLAEFGIAFSRPELWEHRVEHAGPPPTYLYWDLDGGSFRITPWRVVNPTFSVERFLAETVERERDSSWQTIGDHKFVTWEQDGESRSRYYVTGRGDLVITCSFAYDPELYETDEYYSMAVDANLEETAELLESLRF